MRKTQTIDLLMRSD